MSPELKQRLIGAIVVTALAAIFIPMLFDDPVENSSQSVSELVIPATPVNTGEVSANKLPTSANQLLKAPDSGSEAVIETEEEAELPQGKPIAADDPLVDEPIVEEPGADEPGLAVDEPIDEGANTPLDTGLVDEPKTKAKAKKTKEVEQVQEPILDEEEPVVTPPKTVAKKQAKPAKPVAKPTTPATQAPGKTEKVTAKPQKPELSRWTIQAGTFSKKENAMALMETLRKQGMPVTLDTSKGLYRLKVGPILDKKRATEMKAKLDSQKISSMMFAD
ncbi:MAG: SPOR domain-containing protein [Methylococcales bacterium]|nr:SPOR domain-containing protein [Methylococcales bacterium]